MENFFATYLSMFLVQLNSMCMLNETDGPRCLVMPFGLVGSLFALQAKAKPRGSCIVLVAPRPQHVCLAAIIHLFHILFHIKK